jgi:[ribosomal protein S18]-alanine N-acetyltransferase
MKKIGLYDARRGNGDGISRGWVVIELLWSEFAVRSFPVTMPYEVRPLRRADIARVNQIDREAYPNWWPPSNYESELTNQLAHYLVVQAKDSRENPRAADQPLLRRLIRIIQRIVHRESAPPAPPQVIGFTGFWIIAGEAHITTLAVCQERRGRGMGELLLLAALELAIELEASVMTLEVRASNTVAQQLYEKYRFNRVGLRRAYYTDNREDALIMTTEILSSDSFLAHLKQMKQAYTRENPDSRISLPPV